MTGPRLLVLPVLLAAACARNNQLRDGDGGLDLVIGGIVLRVASGGARAQGNDLSLYLTDQPDACLATSQVPTGTAVIFSLRVAPQTSGTTSATVVPGLVVPGPGQAVGAIVALTAGAETARHRAIEGSVSWTANQDGSTTIDLVDIGFEGTGDRLQAMLLTVPPCR